MHVCTCDVRTFHVHGMCMCMSARVRMRVHVCTCACVHEGVHVHVCMRVHVCMHVHVRVHVACARAPTTSSASSSGSRLVTRPTPLAADQRTTVSESLRPARLVSSK